MRLYKKALSTALAISMTLSSFPVAALAETDNNLPSSATAGEAEQTTDNLLPEENTEETEEEETDELTPPEEKPEENEATTEGKDTRQEDTEESAEEATEQTYIPQAQKISEEQMQSLQENSQVGETSPEPWFTIDETDGYITAFNLPENSDGRVVVPDTITSKDGNTKIKVKGLKTTNYDSENGYYVAMTGAESVISLDLSNCTELQSIGGDIFDSCSKLEELKLPANGTSYTIGSYAFNYCTNLLGPLDLSKCTSVGIGAFYECNNITGNINLSNCTYIGAAAFYNCSMLEELKLPANGTSYTIGNYAFYCCTNLLGPLDLSKCTSVGNYAFYECNNITGNINLSNCTYIGVAAFYKCSIYGEIDLSNCKDIKDANGKITSYGVGNYAFYKCDCITDVTWPSSTASVPEYCFYGCERLKSFNKNTTSGVNFNLNGITSIGEAAFEESGIEGKIDLTGCSSIGIYSFYGCENITEIVWPTSVSAIPGYCFANCESLKYFNKTDDVSFNLSGITSIGNAAFAKCAIENTIDLTRCSDIGSFAFKNCQKITEVKWPTSLTEISGSCFALCKSLKYFNKTDSVDFNLDGIKIIYDGAFAECPIEGEIYLDDCVFIGAYAFVECEKLKSVNFPKTSTYEISSNAFCYCTGLTSADLTNCTSIGDKAFQNCVNLTSVTFPKTSYSIGNYVFCSCLSLTSADLTNCTSIGKSAFQSCSSLTSVTPPSQSYSIGNTSFYGCTNLESFDLTNCTSIGTTAFAGCVSLKEVNLTNCTSVGAYAFQNCSGITNINLSNCTSVGNYVFSGCTALENVNIASITSIDSSLFADCNKSLKTVNLSSCTDIPEDSFSNFTKLETVSLSNCQSIGNFAFRYCTNLKTVTLPTKNTKYSIENSAFRGCASLKTVDLSNCESINDYAFLNSGITGEVDLTNCTSVGKKAFSGCSDTIPVVSAKTTKTIYKDAFFDATYVTIIADTEEELVNYCAGIYNDYNEDTDTYNFALIGLSTVNKIAVLENSGVNIAYMNNIDKVIELNAESTYYISATPKYDYKIDGYNTVNAYNILLETVANGTAKTATLSAETAESLPVSFTIDEYDSAKNYYLSTDSNATPTVILTFNKNAAGTYTSSAANVSVAATGSDVAVVSSPEDKLGGDNGATDANSASANPTTGDNADLLASISASLAALALGAASLKKKHKEEE